LKEIYRTGSGSIRLRSTWEAVRSRDPERSLHHQHSLRRQQGAARRTDRRCRPQPQDAAPDRRRDVSTDDVRIELELKAGADDNLVMAYLFKNTSLQTTFAVNMTCLVPNRERRGRQARAPRSQADALALPPLPAGGGDEPSRARARAAEEAHSHLEGFEKVFDALDEIIKIIRKSDGKADSAGEDHEAVLARRRADRRDSSS
jgi:DNA gyrase subunit A